ncbi:hypothetical protein JHK85_007354 [Glycine max]|nr:hypothetical protein JHK85_007354 [Glycine max]KAG5071933.1 hypothetical protein JHK86_007144 [Glycine max]
MTTVFIKYRERFSSGVELRTAVQAEVANPKNPQRGTSNKTTQLDNSATTNHLRKDTSNNKGHGNANHATESTQKSASQTRIDVNAGKLQMECIKAENTNENGVGLANGIGLSV